MIKYINHIENKRILKEYPYIEISDNNYFDLELEKYKDNINDFLFHFKEIFSGKKVKDKYGDTAELKTKKEKINFLNKIMDDEIILLYISIFKKRYFDFNFKQFFMDFINREMYTVVDVFESFNYYNKIIFKEKIDLRNIRFTLSHDTSKIKIIKYKNKNKDIERYEIYIQEGLSDNKLRKDVIENLYKLYKRNIKNLKENSIQNINKYGRNRFNNWINL